MQGEKTSRLGNLARLRQYFSGGSSDELASTNSSASNASTTVPPLRLPDYLDLQIPLEAPANETCVRFKCQLQEQPTTPNATLQNWYRNNTVSVPEQTLPLVAPVVALDLSVGQLRMTDVMNSLMQRARERGGRVTVQYTEPRGDV